MKAKSFIHMFFSLLLCLSVLFSNQNNTVYAQDKIQDSTIFLDWYEANKDNDFAEFELQGDLYLDQGTKEQPIVFDGTGKNISIQCNGFSVYIRSHVIIDHKSLFFLTNWQKASPILIVSNQDIQQRALLTLKNGGASGNQIALQVLSGELECPSGEDRFILNGSRTSVDLQTTDSTLRNLDILAESEDSIIAVKAKENVTIYNSTIIARKFDQTQPANDVLAVEAGNALHIENSQITAVGQGAKSVLSKAGHEVVQIDKSSTLDPIFESEISSQNQFDVIAMKQPEAINVPLGTSPTQLILPASISYTIKSINEQDQATRVVDIPVTWDIQTLNTSLQNYGEYTIQGNVSQTYLDEHLIHMAASYQPKFTLQVVPSTLMDYIRYTDAENEESGSSMRLLLYHPYLATTWNVQYSEDGKEWTNAYCIQGEAQQKEENFLNCINKQENKSVITAYFPVLYQGSYLRSVVNGGVFDGTWQPISLNDESLFTPPGEDGGGGNRGGGGQQITQRDVNQEDENQEEESPQQSTQAAALPQDQPNTANEKQPDLLKQDKKTTDVPVLSNTASNQDVHRIFTPMTITILILPIIIGCLYFVWKRKQKPHA